MDEPVTYASLIRALRGNQSQLAVARLARLTQAEVSRYEAGRVPQLPTGYRLARVLGATAEQLDTVLIKPTKGGRDG